MSNRRDWKTPERHESEMGYAEEILWNLGDAIDIWERHEGDPDAAYDIVASYGRWMRTRRNSGRKLAETAEVLVRDRQRELVKLAYELVSPEGWRVAAQECADVFLGGDVQDMAEYHAWVAGQFDELDDMQIVLEFAAREGIVEESVSESMMDAMNWFLENLDVFTVIGERVREMRALIDPELSARDLGLYQTVQIHDAVMEETARMERVCAYDGGTGALDRVLVGFPGWRVVIDGIRVRSAAIWDRVCDMGSLGEILTWEPGEVAVFGGSGQKVLEPYVYEFTGSESAWRMKMIVPAVRSGENPEVLIRVMELAGARRAMVCGVDCELSPVQAEEPGGVVLYQGRIPYDELRKNLESISIPVCMIWVDGGKAVLGLVK